MEVEARFAGPLPPPGLLKGYEDVCPGAADRIVRMAEDQGKHRRELEQKLAEASVEEMRRGFGEARLGQIFAFMIGIAFLLVGAYVSIHGPSWVGGLFGSIGIGGIVATFIRGREKVKEMAPPSPPQNKKRKR